MRTLQNGTLIVQAYDVDVWLQERNVLRVKDMNATIVGIGKNPSQLIATYTLDANKEAVIDLSDYIRANPGASDLHVRTNSTEMTVVNANYNVVGLINPKNVLVPYNDMIERIWADVAGAFGEDVSDLLIAPPSYMLASIAEDLALVFESGNFAASIWGDYGYQGAITKLLKNGNRRFEVLYGRTFSIEQDVVSYAIGATYFDDYFGKFNVQPLQCGITYAAVRWVSFTGQTRLHTFEVVQRKTETDGAFELLTPDGSFEVVKGRKDGFVLRLDGLNAYDYWYYSDVCHSSNVEVSLDGITWQRVNVTTKEVTTPDGDAGKANTLQVELTYRKYDAVNM